MTDRAIKCTDCNRLFAKKTDMIKHRDAKHREPSFGEIARQAEIDRAMGIQNHDACWLLPDGDAA